MRPNASILSRLVNPDRNRPSDDVHRADHRLAANEAARRRDPDHAPGNYATLGAPLNVRFPQVRDASKRPASVRWGYGVTCPCWRLPPYRPSRPALVVAISPASGCSSMKHARNRHRRAAQAADIVVVVNNSNVRRPSHAPGTRLPRPGQRHSSPDQPGFRGSAAPMAPLAKNGGEPQRNSHRAFERAGQRYPRRSFGQTSISRPSPPETRTLTQISRHRFEEIGLGHRYGACPSDYNA